MMHLKKTEECIGWNVMNNDEEEYKCPNTLWDKKKYNLSLIIITLPDISMRVKMFANGPGDLGSMPGRVIPKIQKWYLMPPCLTLSIIRYVSRVKWSNLRKAVAPSPTPWCNSYRKGSLRVTLDKGSLQVTLDKGRQLYFYKSGSCFL